MDIQATLNNLIKQAEADPTRLHTAPIGRLDLGLEILPRRGSKTARVIRLKFVSVISEYATDFEIWKVVRRLPKQLQPLPTQLFIQDPNELEHDRYTRSGSWEIANLK